MFCLPYSNSVLATDEPQTEQTIITSIHFVGNNKTKKKILLQEMNIKAGDPVDSTRIAISRQAILDLGLFRSVETELLPTEQGGKILQIRVYEKHYVLPIPKLKRSADNDISYGVQLRLDNLGGLNQRMRLTSKTTKTGHNSAGDADSLEIKYTYPRIAGTAFGFNLSAVRVEEPVKESDQASPTTSATYKSRNSSFSLSLRRWLTRDGPSTGWSASAGYFFNNRSYQHLTGTEGLFESGRGAGLTFGITYTRVHDKIFSRQGTQYGINSQLGMTALSSDSSYSRHAFFYRRFHPLGRTPHRNINTQLQLGFTEGSLTLGGHSFSIGGSRSLRGYDKGAITGRSFYLLNTEYLMPIRGHNTLRGVLFIDLGNAYNDNRIIDFSDVESGAGFGIRYKLRSLVKIDLRIDVAYGFGVKDRAAYIGTRSVF